MSWAMTAGRYRRVLLVGADLASCGLNWQHLEASAIFGDGAAAVIISNEGGGRLLASDFMTISEGVDYCCIPAGGSRYHHNRGVCVEEFSALAHFQMQGKAVFKLASQYLPDFLTRLLAKAKLSLSEIDWIVPHQASHLALQHMQQRLGFAAEKVVNIFAHYGNQVAASLPTALDIAISKGDIHRGQTILLLGTGAGLSIAGAVLQF
ncbi:3-oxoacyl-[acyl-carrier-protein] synthase III C-terminal domain-containing protein [Suttonella ornithocola]|nr:3-oxoacyl-[acyl-carrier-protein] synthase III C-terminal domain-containing protein [Suttonella ornithocola]